ncbi:hypothetical protein JOM56_005372 [Amanita muscaria]
MDFSLSDLSQSDNEFSLFCCVFSTLDAPFSVRIGKHKIVDELKQTIKKEKEHAFAEIDFNVLDIWKLSPPILFSELDVKLGHVQIPKDIPGCIKLNPFDQLLECFSSPPPKHVHIIVEIPLNREYSRHHFMSLNDVPSFLFYRSLILQVLLKFATWTLMNVNSASFVRDTGTEATKGGLRSTQMGQHKCHSWQGLTRREQRERRPLQRKW